MSRFNGKIALGCFALFVLTSLEYGFAQSGSRNLGRRPRTPTISREQQQFNQQQNALNQQANAAQQRLQYLNRLAANPNSRENRTQLSEAYNDAKAEFMAIRKGTQPVSGSTLSRPFLLRTTDLNRKARKIKWPKPLLEEQHQESVDEIDEFIKDMKDNAQDLKELIAELSLQIERRVVAKSIEIKDYAKAKRFLSGLANETEL